MPQRIQRKRTKGWKMPEGAIYVGRPTSWGNDYQVGVDGTAEECVDWYEQQLLAMQRNNPGEFNRLIAVLAGKDLVCWCRLDQPCHADILLELANESA